MKVEVIKDGKVIQKYNQSVEALVPSKHDTITVNGEELVITDRKIDTEISSQRGHHSVQLFV
jgi:archaellum component FlaF (FlaF/FlaG flagellin family)